MKAILFDVYGTLISTGNGSVTAAKKILEENRSALDPAAFYAHWKKLHKAHMQVGTFLSERAVFLWDLKTLYTEYGILADAEQDVQIMLDSLYDRKAFAETKAVLEQLAEKYTLVLATNTDTEPLLQNLAHNEMNFEHIYTSEMLRCYKPDARFYAQIMEELHCSAAELLFVGDSGEEDVRAPKRLGLRTVFIDRKQTGADFGQDGTFPDLTGLLQML